MSNLDSVESEAAFTARICDEMRAAGAVVHVLTGNALSSGLPDRLVVTAYGTWLLEFKAADGRLRLNQALAMQEMARRQPKLCLVVRSPRGQGEPILLQTACEAAVHPSRCLTVAEVPTGIAMMSDGERLLQVLTSLQ